MKVKIFQSLQDAERTIPERGTKRASIHGKRICLARSKGKFFAIQDQCPHSGASLSEGKVNPRGDVVCPLHNYCYSLTTGREYNEQSEDAETWKITVEEDGVYIHL